MKKYLLVGFPILILGSVAFLNWLNQPNNGSVQPVLNSDVLSASKSTTELQTNYYTTSYDSTLRIKTSTENDSDKGSIYSQLLLSSKNGSNDSQIAVTIAEKENTINDVSPAKFRLLEDNQYKLSSVSFAPADSLVFIKSSDLSYEIAVIWQGNSYYSAVVGSGTSADKERIDELVADVVSNWQWKN